MPCRPKRGSDIETRAGLVSGPSGLTIDIQIEDRLPLPGDGNRVLANVTFSDSTILSAELDVLGALPRSAADFVI